MTKRPVTEAEKLEFLEQSLDKLFGKKFKLHLGDNLYDLGIDSLDTVELQINFEDTFNVVLPDVNKPMVYIQDLIQLM